MRKEKSRDAARSRRGKENHEFYELAKMLPLPAAITSQLDKASIIRLTISYLKLREFSQNGEPSWNNALSSMSALKCKANSIFESHQGTHILQSLDGFAFALGQDGRFLYISETVSIYLGLSQVEMTGSSIFDYTHQQDHTELAEQLGLSHVAPNSANNTMGTSIHHHHSNSPLPPASVSSNASNESDSGGGGTHYSNGHGLMTSTGVNDTFERQFCMRMKSTLTKRGCQHFKSSGYRVVNIVAHLRAEMLRRSTTTSSGQIMNGNSHSKIIGLVALAIALPPPSINELRLEPDMFVTRHSLDFKILHCEQRVTELLNYLPEELIGRNFYSLIHGQDVTLMKKCHLDLIHKGQSMSGYYRIINKSGGYTWVQTCATLICNNPPTTTASSANSNAQNKSSSNSNNNNSPGSSTPNTTTVPNTTPVPPSGGQDDQEQSVICVNYVLSAIEYTGIIMDTCQIGSKIITTSTSHTGSKIRSLHIKKSHSSSPSPEIIGTKLNNVMRPSVSIELSSGGSGAQCQITAASQNESHMTRSPRLASSHSSSSPMESPSDNIKRRRMNSSPVRPWKSPSPPNNSMGNIVVPSSTANESTVSSTSPNLLRHISVIRETPPILKPQVMAPTPYHAHHPYHHLVDQYAAAYHLYKTGPNGAANPISPQNSNQNASPHQTHHWSAYG
ncbi:neuronal pas domain protein-like protein [Dermatophagoides farinae]|uniref:Neuronal pas domain protein-like protein n=1 Tax=Dermatophagoides farinae TaxID=6954 RepID=A0A9D4P6Z1_DERFA|nr:protein trachealess-like [Dermatophagoides farinae]XP_046912973.1 protein trachealess-like [Dermatophagoides farinae]XP_046912980.1 protein trachealess-like [Dermatophagoides farinae]XP_046912989.1 protein trachealess-like [Dermatophagoides farinae]KAH7645241.1 neuronal pas domain protein-like protein [Dermatophagoides farinae]